MAMAHLPAFLNKVSLTISLSSCFTDVRAIFCVGSTCHGVEIMEMSCCDFTVCSGSSVRVVTQDRSLDGGIIKITCMANERT